MWKQHDTILASDRRPDYLQLIAGVGSVELKAAAEGASGADALPKISMRVYTGGVITLGILFASGRYYVGPVVVDLTGMQLPGGFSPVLRDHDTGRVIGHGTPSIVESVLSLDGVASGTGPDAQEFISTSRNKFPWQASMGALVLAAEDVEPGVEVQINGKTFTGPLLVARQTILKESSVVCLGADSGSAAQVAASLKNKESEMDPKLVLWLNAKGHKPEALSEAQQASLKGEWEAEVRAAEAPAAVSSPAPASATPAGNQNGDLAAARVEGARIERERQVAIRAAASGVDVPADQVEAAINAGDSPDAANARFLQALRNRAPSVGTPAIGGGSERINARIIEAGMCLAFQRHVGMDDAALTRQYGEQGLNAAGDFRRLRLTEFVELCARADNVRLPLGRGSDAWIRAAFSSTSLPGILSNVANKALLAAYQAVPSAARQICRIGRVNDFKAHTRYRLTGDMTFQKVAPGGEIPHGKLGEQSFTQKADTYGIMGGLTRQDLRNDDMGALLGWAEHVGRGAATSIEEIFFALLLANTGSFFGSDNSNIYADAAAGLGDAALTVMVALMRNQTDPHGKPVNVTPEILLVPPALMDLAQRLFVSRNLIVTALGSTSAAAVAPGDNVHAGRYRPVDSPYLSNTTFHANASTVDWYLFANPAVLAAFEIAFLDGVETPTIEFTEADFNVLGMRFRGYHDVGVGAMDPRAAAKADVG